MYGLTPYGLEQCLKFGFTTSSVTRPTAWYVARHVGNPGDTGSLNEETTGGDSSYARLSVSFGASTWSSVLSMRTAASSSSVTFTPAAGAGTRTYYGLSVWDALTGGNCLFVINFGTYTVEASNVSPLTVNVGDLMCDMIRNPLAPTHGLTEYGMQLFLNWLLTTESVTRPTAWYASMHTADPGTAGSANELTTGVDANYVRKSLTFANPSSITGKGTECRNNSAVSWTPAGGSSYTTTHFGIFNALSSGTSLCNVAAKSPRSSSGTIALSENQISLLGVE
jgi:hypothetical protein